MKVNDVRLSDKYELPAGRVFMTGTQVLVRLMLAQKARDEMMGLNTEGFVSGYRGSPLGGFDLELWKNRKLVAEHGIPFDPGLKEELAATVVTGTQMVTFEQFMHPLASELDADRLPLAIELARLPQTVRGFGHVKKRNAKVARQKQAELLARWQKPQTNALRAAA